MTSPSESPMIFVYSPVGHTWVTHGFVVLAHESPRVTRELPVGHPWVTHGSPTMLYACSPCVVTNDSPMGRLRVARRSPVGHPRGLSMGYPSIYHGPPIDLPCVTHGPPMDHPRVAHGSPVRHSWVVHGSPIGYRPWSTHGRRTIVSTHNAQVCASVPMGGPRNTHGRPMGDPQQTDDRSMGNPRDREL